MAFPLDAGAGADAVDTVTDCRLNTFRNVHQIDLASNDRILRTWHTAVRHQFR